MSTELNATSWVVASYAQLTENAQHVLVVLTNDRHPLNEKYTKSGLYSLEDSTQALWEIEGYSAEFIPSSDGRHLVEFGSFEARWDSTAVAFHQDGIELQRYKIRDLVKDTSKAIPSSAGLLWGGQSLWDDERNQLILTTADSLCYTFSAETGKILSVETYNRRHFASKRKELKRLSKKRAKAQQLSEFSKNSILDLVERDYLIARSFGPTVLQDKSFTDAVIKLAKKTQSDIKPAQTFAQRLSLWWARMLYSGENYH